MAYLVYTLNVQVADVNERQADVNRMEIREKALRQLNDRSTQDLSAIVLAEHGDDALSSLEMLLGVDSNTLRSGGVLVALHMFRAETVDRAELIKKLLAYAKARNQFLRRGAYESFKEIHPELSIAEHQQVLGLLEQRFGTTPQAIQERDKEAAITACQLLAKYLPSESGELT